MLSAPAPRPEPRPSDEGFKKELSKTIGDEEGALYPDANDGGVEDNGVWSPCDWRWKLPKLLLLRFELCLFTGG